jgi:hypothetical protein
MGGGLIAVAWLARTPAYAVLGTVAASAGIAAIGKHMLFVPNHALAFGLVLTATVAVLIVRWSESSTP